GFNKRFPEKVFPPGGAGHTLIGIDREDFANDTRLRTNNLLNRAGERDFPPLPFRNSFPGEIIDTDEPDEDAPLHCKLSTQIGRSSCKKSLAVPIANANSRSPTACLARTFSAPPATPPSSLQRADRSLPPRRDLPSYPVGSWFRPKTAAGKSVRRRILTRTMMMTGGAGGAAAIWNPTAAR